MMKRIVCCLLLLLFCCGEAGQCRAADFQAPEAASWANVRDYGAVGDAKYHHPLGERSGEWLCMAGHFSQMTMVKHCIPYVGREKTSSIYQIVPNNYSPSVRQIRLSDVKSGQANYTPSVGHTVAVYTAPDLTLSVPATDDSAAFEQAIAAGDGRLYLPEGDYMISQLTAAKIKNITGPGTLWLKEWTGGNLYYLAAGISPEPLIFKNYGWINAARFHNDIWKDMHWTTCLPQVRGWQDSGSFSGNISPRMEFSFDKNRDNLNVWITVQPAVAEKDFPDSVTVCISNVSANYTLKGRRSWNRASGSGIGGSLFHLSWDGNGVEIDRSAWRNCGDRVEITLKREDLFRHGEDGKAGTWALHCWSLDNRNLSGKSVEYVCNTAQVWVKEEKDAGYLMCDIGCDMRTTWEKRNVKEGYIMEACDCGTQLLTASPRRFYAYTVPDSAFNLYSPFPK